MTAIINFSFGISGVQFHTSVWAWYYSIQQQVPLHTRIDSLPTPLGLGLDILGLVVLHHSVIIYWFRNIHFWLAIVQLCTLPGISPVLLLSWIGWPWVFSNARSVALWRDGISMLASRAVLALCLFPSSWLNPKPFCWETLPRVPEQVENMAWWRDIGLYLTFLSIGDSRF